MSHESVPSPSIGPESQLEASIIPVLPEGIVNDSGLISSEAFDEHAIQYQQSKMAKSARGAIDRVAASDAEDRVPRAVTTVGFNMSTSESDSGDPVPVPAHVSPDAQQNMKKILRGVFRKPRQEAVAVPRPAAESNDDNPTLTLDDSTRVMTGENEAAAESDSELSDEYLNKSFWEVTGIHMNDIPPAKNPLTASSAKGYISQGLPFSRTSEFINNMAKRWHEYQGERNVKALQQLYEKRDRIQSIIDEAYRDSAGLLNRDRRGNLVGIDQLKVKDIDRIHRRITDLSTKKHRNGISFGDSSAASYESEIEANWKKIAIASGNIFFTKEQSEELLGIIDNLPASANQAASRESKQKQTQNPEGVAESDNNPKQPELTQGWANLVAQSIKRSLENDDDITGMISDPALYNKRVDEEVSRVIDQVVKNYPSFDGNRKALERTIRSMVMG